MTIALCAQVVLTFAVDGEGPVKFGWPVPVAALERGLRLKGSPEAQMQWSVLQPAPGLDTERVWVVVAVVGQRGSGRLLLGGALPSAPGDGPVLRSATTTARDETRVTESTTWTWSDGTVDRIQRTSLLCDDGEREAGETLFADGGAVLERRARVRIRASEWRRVGVLPPADGSGAAWRKVLVELVPRLPVAPGPRGRGDFVRGAAGEIVTNLEFDTTLGFVRLALAGDDPHLLGRAWDAARHLVDVDLEVRSGLPFRHAAGHHRVASPEPGHVWITGLLLVGCSFGERELVERALGIARALAARMRGRPHARGPFDRLRDEAWPLYELENVLRFADLPPLRTAADEVGRAILDRWDPAMGSLCYGEGETSNPAVRRQRLWLSLGIAVPALELHHARTGDARIAGVVRSLRERAVRVLLDGQDGVPIQLALGPSGPFDAVRREAIAESFLLLDGLGTRARRRVLARTAVRRALDGALDWEHDDLATRFSIVARCGWILR